MAISHYGDAVSILLENCSDNRDKFLQIRTGKIGSSDIAAISGLNPYRTPLQVWLQMTGRTDRSEENDAMFLGHQLEPVVASMYHRRTGATLEKADRIIARNSLPHFIATPDYEIVDEQPGFLECKTTHARSREWESEIPIWAEIQLQWQMGIAGIDHGAVACLRGGRDFSFRSYQFDSVAFDRLVAIGTEFIQRVHSDSPPEAKGDDLPALTSLHGLPNEKEEMQADGDLADMIAAYAEHHADLKTAKSATSELEKQLKDLEAIIRQRMGHAGRANAGRYIAEQKTIERGEYVCRATSYVKFALKEVK